MEGKKIKMDIENITPEYLQRIADNVKRQAPGLGFILFLFEFNTRDKTSRYITNAKMDSMIEGLEEMVDQIKNKRHKDLTLKPKE